MKFNINKSENKGKKEEKSYKILAELILFVFSMCAVTLLLIFGTIESRNSTCENDISSPTFEENGFYKIFDLDLLEIAKKEDGVSEIHTVAI